jgi:hypothetical protein
MNNFQHWHPKVLQFIHIFSNVERKCSKLLGTCYFSTNVVHKGTACANWRRWVYIAYSNLCTQAVYLGASFRILWWSLALKTLPWSIVLYQEQHWIGLLPNKNLSHVIGNHQVNHNFYFFKPIVYFEEVAIAIHVNLAEEVAKSKGLA